MEQYVLTGDARQELGSRAAKRLRDSGRIPANLYGHKEENLHFSLNAKEFTHFLEAGHRFVTIRLGPKEEQSVVKEVQYDAFGTTLVHADFARVSRDEKIEVEVPVETFGIPKGVSSGGHLEVQLKEIKVEGLPRNLPESYTLNIEALEMGESVRVKDLTAPKGCTFIEHAETVVVTVAHPHVEAAEAVEEAAQPEQPEVIGKKKEEPEDSGGQ